MGFRREYRGLGTKYVGSDGNIGGSELNMWGSDMNKDQRFDLFPGVEV